MNRKRNAILRILFCGQDTEYIRLIQTYLLEKLNRKFTLTQACYPIKMETAFLRENVDLVLMDINAAVHQLFNASHNTVDKPCHV